MQTAAMTAAPESERVLILDFGAQYGQLIARRVREPMTIQKLAEAPLILYDARWGADDPMRRQLRERAQRAGVKIELSIEGEYMTAALELAHDHGEPDVVVVCVGGGGLAAGWATALPNARVVAAEPAGRPALRAALHHGHPAAGERRGAHPLPRAMTRRLRSGRR